MLALLFAAIARAFGLNQPGVRRWKSAMIPLAAGVLLILALAACGGGGNNNIPVPPSNPGTPAGNYTITVTGTATSGSSSAIFSIALPTLTVT